MKRVIAIVALATLSSVGAYAQQAVTRAPVILIRTPTPPPTQILPDPSGIYQGAVTLTDATGSFNQTWRADVKAQPCPDCDPGVYYLDATTFYAIEYTSGRIEKGGIRGIVGTSGTLHGLQFTVANCPWIQADGSYTVATYYGGNFGTIPGTKLTLKNGVLSGSISGNDCFHTPFTATVSMSKVSSGPVLSCVSGLKAGVYNASFANSCGGSASIVLEVVRSGCILSAVAPGLAALEATMTGPNTFTLAIFPLGGCQGNPSGTGTISADGTITGTYSGNSSGGAGCCPPGPYSGSFSLSPR